MLIWCLSVSSEHFNGHQIRRQMDLRTTDINPRLLALSILEVKAYFFSFGERENAIKIIIIIMKINGFFMHHDTTDHFISLNFRNSLKAALCCIFHDPRSEFRDQNDTKNSRILAYLLFTLTYDMQCFMMHPFAMICVCFCASNEHILFYFVSLLSLCLTLIVEHWLN